MLSLKRALRIRQPVVLVAWLDGGCVVVHDRSGVAVKRIIIKPSHRRYRAPRLDIHDATAAASDDEATAEPWSLTA